MHRGRWLSLLLALVTVAACALGLVACGSDDPKTQISSNENTKAPAEPDDAAPEADTQSDRVKQEEPGDEVNGQFEATPGEGYTLNVAYQLEPLEPEVDIANARPGEAILYLSSSGELTYTNTTRARNLEFSSHELPLISLYWLRSQLPPSERCTDALFVRGVAHCGLAAFRGEFDPQVEEGAIELGPDASTAITLNPRLVINGITVDEQQAEAVSKLIRSTKPSLVTLLLDGLELGCSFEEFGASGWTAVLTGGGQVLAGEGSGEEAEEPPLCSEI